MTYLMCLPSMYSMGTDWNQVMAQYGSLLSEEYGTQFQNIGFAPPQPDIPAQGSAPAPPVKGGQHTKLANFTFEEDMRVCRAWLDVSCDPIVNTGQKRQGFWNRIIEAYNSRRGSMQERSTKSLTSMWDSIKTQCSTFAGYMTTVLRQNPSGLTDADKVCVYTYASVLKST
jgi:hypothetical protein